eukprot:gnl/MRDRNA2_/MRDRNA2_63255_c0_seq1.p1 gnl/MRDRNA2_/MRDRNA2_63255_c0~~gnl/MRDRNA2_/MRDRNA2_63255_c0_seq1.p1  ORF type:complete len:473 (+),score=86.36 gnl/MRDRNA2_/MRDRNA2_63255_c0_seq1:102-1520(+)
MTARDGSQSSPVEIRVCQGGSCRRAGSKAVLLEIEELAKALGDCEVRPSRCVKACRKAPNAIVVRGHEKLKCTRIKDLQKSAAMVQQATGRAPKLDDPALVRRLAGARELRIEEQSKADSKKRKKKDKKKKKERKQKETGKKESKKKKHKKRRRSSSSSSQLTITSSSETTISSRSCKSEGKLRMDNYAKWRMESVTNVSKHSAIFRFSSKDSKRGTPNQRGIQSPKTWHTTLLANVGANSEGPSPWIERDYTPISSWKEWVQGRCDILIKIYSQGLATSWLHKTQPGCDMWFSRPVKTLDVPSLVPDLNDTAFKSPASVLLVLGGTGIVAAAQVLHHADRAASLGPTPVMTSPISLIYSCRRDDVLMIKDLIGWCNAGQLERCTLTLTQPEAGMVPPFPDIEDADLSELASLTNARVVFSSISQEILGGEVELLKSPCRVLVSGPASFNAEVKDMLSDRGVGPDEITLLTA